MISNILNLEYNLKIVPWMILFFVIPVFPFLVPSSIVVVLFVFFLRYRELRFQWDNFYILIFPIMFFVIYLIGLFWTDTPDMRSVVVERKLSFLIFPLIFILHPPFSSRERFVLWLTFIAGAFLYTLISLVNALFCFIHTGSRDCFFSSALSYELHPSYSALYLVMILSYLFHLLLTGNPNLRFRILYIGLIFWFSFFVFLLASKAGIISLILIYIFVAVYFLVLRKQIKQLALLVGFGLLSFFFMMRYASVPLERFRNALIVTEIPDKELFSKYGSSIESNVVRRMIWKCGMELILEYPMGVGSGDANTALMKKYKEKGMIGAYGKEFNAHNQFLQTGIATGWIGLGLLIVFFLWNFVISWKRLRIILFLFLLFCLLNLVVESMFETQAGIVYITLFFCFLCTDSKKNHEIYT